MRAFFSQSHVAHAPKTYLRNGKVSPYKDVPERVMSMLAVAQELGYEIVAPRDFGEDPLLRVHSSEYLHFLATAYERWCVLVADGDGSEMAYADRYLVRDYQSRLPSSIQGQIGYYLSGSSVPIVESSYLAIVASAYTALEGAEALLAGDDSAYAICRPPGHHAYRDLAGGYCYLNNSAIAVEHLKTRFPRVAVFDVDVHHGNGTQGLFYRRGDVFFASIHADPNYAYPFYSGYGDETGEGKGAGTTLNLPMPVGTSDAAYVEALATAINAIGRFSPDALVISLGLDAHRDDPQRLFALSTDTFRVIGEAIGGLKLPTLFVQEGGYAVGDVGASLGAFLGGYSNGRCRDVGAP